MQDALTSAGVVILASQAPVGIIPAVTPLTQFCQPENPAAVSGFCKEGTPGAMGYASVNMPIDDDGFIRQANLFLAGDPPALSYPLMLAQQFAGQSIEPGSRTHAVFLGHRIPYANPDLKTFLIGCWGREPATRIPAWKLLAGEVPPQTFADKLVLIGQTSSASNDTHFTPLFRMAGKDGVRLRMGGTAIHAAAIRTLLEGRAVHPSPRTVSLLSILAISSVAATLLLTCDLSVGLTSLLMLMVLANGVVWLLYAKWRFWLPLLPMETSLILAVPLHAWRALRRGTPALARGQRPARPVDGPLLQLRRPGNCGDHLAAPFRAFPRRRGAHRDRNVHRYSRIHGVEQQPAPGHRPRLAQPICSCHG